MVSAINFSVVVLFFSALEASAHQPLRAQAQTPSLQMVEVGALPLPDTAVITGMAVAPSGTVVLSFGTGPSLAVLRRAQMPREVRSLRLRRPVGVALLPGDSLVEAVDTAGSLVRRVRLGADGRVVAEQRFAVPLVPATAVRGDDGWYVGGADTAGVYRIYRLNEAAGVAQEAGSVPAGATRLIAHLTLCHGMVVVTERTEPFRNTRLVPGGTSHDFEPFAPPAEAAADSARAGIWHSAPTVCLGDGYLRTLADLRSDRRILVMYGADGRVVRTREIEAPFAVVASVPGASALLAVRRVGAPELVWYEWRWSGTNP